MNTLADDYPREQERLRELVQLYKDIGPSGVFGLGVIEGTLRMADKAAAEHDTVAMIAAYQAMRECK